jgi:putative sigma-54 modulation protein
MNLQISGHHVDLTSALRDFVSSKMRRIERHFDHLIDASVILTVEKLRHKAEATLHVRGATLHAEEVQEDMYAAIDRLIDKLDRQICKFKEKRKDHHVEDSIKTDRPGRRLH